MLDINLESLKHSPRTNLTKGKINNHDAALLIIAAAQDGLITSKEVKNALKAWRSDVPERKYVYLWNTCTGPGNSFVGANIRTPFNVIRNNVTDSLRRTYWCRVKRGVYRVTLEGYRRLGELQSQT